MATSLRLPPELEADIKALAKANQRTMHSEMLYALKTYVAYQKGRAKVSQKRIDEWADSMIDSAVEAVTDSGVDVTPENLSAKFGEMYDFPFTSEEARTWLESQDWYQA